MPPPERKAVDITNDSRAADFWLQHDWLVQAYREFDSPDVPSDLTETLYYKHEHAFHLGSNEGLEQITREKRTIKDLAKTASDWADKSRPHFVDFQGKLICMDGRHRACAMKALGKPVRVFVAEVPPVPLP